MRKYINKLLVLCTLVAPLALVSCETDTDSKIRLFDVERTDEEVEAFRKELEEIKDIISEAEVNKRFYRNTCHCNAWGRRCEYSSICLNYDPSQSYIEFTKAQ